MVRSHSLSATLSASLEKSLVERKRQAINLAWLLLVAVEAELRYFHTLMPPLIGSGISIVVLWWKYLNRKKAL